MVSFPSIKPKYRLLSIFQWLQLNEISYTAFSHQHLEIFSDIFQNSKYFIGKTKNFRVFIIPTFDSLQVPTAQRNFLYDFLSQILRNDLDLFPNS